MRETLTPRLPIWRLGRGWSEAERRSVLTALGRLPVSYGASETAGTPDRLGSDHRPALAGASAGGWSHDVVAAAIGREPPGPPRADGPFFRARAALTGYRFADPRITDGRFDAECPLLGRDILVQTQVVGLYVLVGLRVGAVAEHAGAGRTVFGIRLDTLAGHLLDGSEWISVAKEHASGLVQVRIEAHWRPGRALAWWSRLGFRAIGRQSRRRWQRQAVRRLRILANPDHR